MYDVYLLCLLPYFIGTRNQVCLFTNYISKYMSNVSDDVNQCGKQKSKNSSLLYTVKHNQDQGGKEMIGSH